MRGQGVQAVVANTGLHRTAEWRLLKACLHLLLDERDSLSKAEIQFLTSENHEIETLLDERLQFLKDAGNNDDKINSWMNDHEAIRWIEEQRTNLNSEPVNSIIQLMYSGLGFQSRVMQWDGGEQRIANLQQILTYSTIFEDYCAKLGLLPNAHGFLAWFDALAENDKDERGVVANKFSVNVLTYHKAKGLEWPIVILYGLDEEHEPNLFAVRVNAKDRMEFEKPLDGRTLRFWPWPYGSTQYGPRTGFKKFTDCCKETDEYNSFDEREKAEQLRLLYVGFTRARDYLIISNKTEKRQSWLQMLIDDDIETFTGVPTDNCDLEINIRKHFNSLVRLWISSYNSLAKPVGVNNKSVDIFTEGEKKEWAPYRINPSKSEIVENIGFIEETSIGHEFLSAGIDEERTDFGNFIHEVLCAFRPAMKNAAANHLIRRLADQYEFTQNVNEEELLHRIRDFYRWIMNLKPIQIHKELPLMMEADGQLISGFADMVIETASSVILIDYKTFVGNSAAMKWKAKNFSGQLKKYSDILKKVYPGKEIRSGIYFIMMGKWWEVEENSLQTINPE